MPGRILTTKPSLHARQGELSETRVQSLEMELSTYEAEAQGLIEASERYQVVQETIAGVQAELSTLPGQMQRHLEDRLEVLRGELVDLHAELDRLKPSVVRLGQLRAAGRQVSDELGHAQDQVRLSRQPWKL